MVVYMARNELNGKVYIGKTIHSLDRRRKAHLGESRRGGKRHFTAALRKYGEQNFSWRVVASGFTSDEELKEAEIWWIEKMNQLIPGKLYNCTAGGDGLTGFKPNAETKAKQREAKLGCIPWNKGKTGVYTEETISLMSERKSRPAWNKGKKMSTEFRQRCREGQLRLYQAGYQNPNTGRVVSQEQRDHLSHINKERGIRPSREAQLAGAGRDNAKEGIYK